MRKMLMGGAIALMTMGTAATRSAAMDGRDMLGVALGALAIGAIANSANAGSERAYAADYRRDGDHRTDEWGHNDWHVGKWNRHRNDRYGRRGMVLPESCLTTFRTSRGLRAAMDGRCMRREGIRVNRLPDRCERQVRTRHGSRTVYGLSCLDRQGYRISRRR